MKRSRQFIHLVPRDAALLRILEIEAHTLCMVDRLLQLVPNKPLLPW